jgi:catechol 2,3-dioxygenase-like lactoylglutathione lyase family enzyme
MDTDTIVGRDGPLCKNLDVARISEIVLKTSQFGAIREWYVDALGIEPFYENSPERTGGADGKFLRASDVRLCFFRLHLDFPYAQVLAIFEVPNLKGGGTTEAGLHHMQFRNSSLDQLFERHDLLKSVGILPHRTANHGPGTSFYYFDPDGNNVEFSGANFDTEAEYLAYFASESYRRNPSGIEIDAEAYMARYRGGTPKAELVRID